MCVPEYKDLLAPDHSLQEMMAGRKLSYEFSRLVDNRINGSIEKPFRLPQDRHDFSKSYLTNN